MKNCPNIFLAEDIKRTHLKNPYIQLSIRSNSYRIFKTHLKIIFDILERLLIVASVRALRTLSAVLHSRALRAIFFYYYEGVRFAQTIFTTRIYCD